MFTNKNLRDLILPLIIEQFLAVFVGMMDTLMISAAGEAAVSGVSLVDNVMILMIGFFAALGTGGAVVAGFSIGRKDLDTACKSAEQMVLLVTESSLLIMAVLYLIRPFILHRVFGSITADVERNANIYFMIVTASVPFIALYNGAAALFRTMGNSSIAMKTSVLMNAVNVTGNAIMVYGLHMGAAGVAWPTLISRAVSAVVITVLLTKQTYPVHLRRGMSLKPDFSMIRRILHIGIPNGLENSIFQLGKLLVLSLVSTFGTAAIAANAVSGSIANFENIPGLAIGMAMVTVVSQCVGTGDYEHVRRYIRKLMWVCYAAMWVTILIIVLTLPYLVKVYNLSPEAAGYTRQIILYHSICDAIFWQPSFTLPNALRAAGDVNFTMIVSLVSMWTFRIIMSYVLGSWLGMGVFGVWVAMTIDWLFRAAAFIWRYRGHKWENQKV